MSDTTAPPGTATARPPSATNGQQSSQDATDQAKAKAQDAAGQAKEKAQEAGQKASDRARSEVDRRSTEAGEQVTSTASDLRSVGEKLREEGKDTPARLAEQAADRTEQVGNYLRDSDADRILGDVEDFARRQPWAVVAGGLVLGFAASRFLKASSSERYRSSQQTRVQEPAPGPYAQVPPPAATTARS
jgi:hypothetical protein